MTPDHEGPLSVVHTAVAHDQDINAVCVSPNDKLIATASQDKTAKVSMCYSIFDLSI